MGLPILSATTCATTSSDFVVLQSQCPAAIQQIGMGAADCVMVLQRQPASDQCFYDVYTDNTQIVFDDSHNVVPVNAPGRYRVNKPCGSACNVSIYISVGSKLEDV